MLAFEKVREKVNVTRLDKLLRVLHFVTFLLREVIPFKMKLDGNGIHKLMKEGADYVKRLIDAIPPEIYYTQEVEYVPFNQRNKHKKMKLTPNKGQTSRKPVKKKEVVQGRNKQRESNPELAEKLRAKISDLSNARGGEKLTKEEKAEKQFLNSIKKKKERKEKRKQQAKTPKSKSSPSKSTKSTNSELDKAENAIKSGEETTLKVPKASNKNISSLKRKLTSVKKLEEAHSKLSISEKQDKDWETLVSKAKGENDRELSSKFLKKKIKRLEKAKEKKQKGWKARERKTDHDKKKKQTRRESNLKKRQDKRVNRKLKLKGLA